MPDSGAAGFFAFVAVLVLLVIEHRLGRIQKALEKLAARSNDDPRGS